MVTLTGAVRQLPAVPAAPTVPAAPVVMTTPPSRITEEMILNARPAEEVWPHALAEIPARAADGLAYRPVAALDAGHILLVAESGAGAEGGEGGENPESAGNTESDGSRQGAGAADRQVRLEAFSMESRQTSVLAVQPVTPGLSGYMLTQAGADEHHLVWRTVANRGDTDQAGQVRVMPRAGGDPKLLVAFDKSHELWDMELAPAGDAVLFTGAPRRVSP
nr:hypothetical protein GCM10020093_077190 [Planobispora longispora]